MSIAAVILTSQLLFLPQFETAKVFLVKTNNSQNKTAPKVVSGQDYAASVRTSRSCARTPRSRKGKRRLGNRRNGRRRKKLPGFWIRGGSGQTRVLSRSKGRQAREVDCSKGDCFCCTKGSKGAVVHKPSKCISGGPKKGRQVGI